MVTKTNIFRDTSQPILLTVCPLSNHHLPHSSKFSMDALVYSTVCFNRTDYQQISQQLSLQRQKRVKVQNLICAQIPKRPGSLSSVLGKETKVCFHKTGPEASICCGKPMGFLLDNPLQGLCFTHHWLEACELQRNPFPKHH